MLSTKTQGLVKRGVPLFLILALLVPVLLAVPVSAEVETVLYNGVELPVLPVDFSSYPYQVIYYNNYYSTYTLFGSMGDGTSGDYAFEGDLLCLYGSYIIYNLVDGAWSLVTKQTTTGGAQVSSSVLWSNFDIYKNGTLWQAGSEPVDPNAPVYPTSAETPVFDVNLSADTTYTYEVGETAESLSVSASVTDGGTLAYEWFESSDVTQEAVGTAQTFTPPTDTAGTYSYACKVTNAVYNPDVEGEYLYATAYSWTVTVVVNEATVTDPSDSADATDPSEDVSDSTESTENSRDNPTRDDVEAEGNELIDQLEEIIPNNSAEFVDALEKLASALTYDGTAAKMVIPEVVLPSIGGLTPEFTMMQEQELDFEIYFDMMPDLLLLLAQSLLTAALIAYCFMELYEIISYLFVLKGART